MAIRPVSSAGFLSYGHGYGLIQYDMIREALLMTYSIMAHQYTRGTWMAPETRNVLIDRPAAPYCTPAQLVVSLMTRWMLVFEDPQSETLWLGKRFRANGWKTARLPPSSDAPTRWGRIGYSITSHLQPGTLRRKSTLPSTFRGDYESAPSGSWRCENQIRHSQRQSLDTVPPGRRKHNNSRRHARDD